MLVTAHGGSFGTGRNTEKYFQTIKDYNVDIIEVDIWKRGDLLYISHLPRLFPKLWTLPLSYVFEFVKEHRFKVNCDVKQGGLVKPVTELARSYGVEDLILFTGSVKPFEIKDVTNEVWLNRSFFGMPPVCENVGKMKACGRFIQDIYRLPRTAPAQLRRQLNPLRLPSGQGGRRLPQTYIRQSHIVQRLHFSPDTRHMFKKCQRLLHRHI